MTSSSIHLSGRDVLDQERELLDAWVDVRRRIASLEADAADLLAQRSAVRDAEMRRFPAHRDMIHRSMIAEYSAAGRISTRAIENAFADADLTTDTFPGVREALRSGTIAAGHVREIVQASAILREAVHNGAVPAAALASYEVAALAVAEQDSPARTRVAVREIAAALAQRTAQERQKDAWSERCVTVRSVEDGLALLTVVLPEHLAVAIRDRLTRLARTVARARARTSSTVEFDSNAAAEDASTEPGDDRFIDDEHISPELVSADPVSPEPDSRTMDQLRADILTDLLLATDPTDCHGTALDGITAHVQVTVAATTLAGADDRLAELDGHGPLHPDIARDLATRGGPWTRLFLDPSGQVTETDTYSPTEAMKRHLRARDQHCRFPGCRMPALASQLDHNHDHAKGGKTRLDNLAAFCAGHHPLKHPDIHDRFRWTARALPDGSIAWRSPLGRQYGDPPPRRVLFA
ncbi:hypothetical protein GCM10025768_20310 [Microbacterium pseudoresistens]|uniref:DUF222 domain-containing protein n=1 Tax=Microbacterium pseudoresistens TaxID=640634 RepID=A0A7Y9EXF1_9MICO|nr:HNH endonuclease signature motif containing protein [Microbacterium pseudoresistens]NYD55724.1 hypothetical protein [Microbacterium pseudoresistens]